MKIGDKVAFYSVVGDRSPSHTGRIRAVYPWGIPSCKSPMVSIEGKSGIILQSHCEIVR